MSLAKFHLNEFQNINVVIISITLLGTAEGTVADGPTYSYINSSYLTVPIGLLLTIVNVSSPCQTTLNVAI